MNAKDTYLKLGDTRLTSDVLCSKAMAQALDYAMLELQEELDGLSLSRPADTLFWQMTGARRFRRILEELANPPSDKGTLKSATTLNYDAYERPTRASTPK